MKEKLESIGSLLLNILMFLAGALLLAFFIKGGVWLSELILPWLSLVILIVFILAIIIFLPLAIFKKTRTFSGVGLFIVSYIFGACLWIWSFLLTYLLWGTTALIVGLFLAGIGVVPMAMLAVLFKGGWSIFGQLVVLFIITYGSRMLGIYLSEETETY